MVYPLVPIDAPSASAMEIGKQKRGAFCTCANRK
jgi:hypothetical protein